MPVGRFSRTRIGPVPRQQPPVNLSGTVTAVARVDDASVKQLVKPSGTVTAVASVTGTLTVVAEPTVQVTEDGRLVFSGAVAEGGDIPISRIRLVGTPQSGTAGSPTAVTLTFDGSPQEGDVALVIGGHGTADADTPAAGPSTAGYTELAFEDWTADENLTFGVWYKVMGATPDTNVVCEAAGDSGDVATYVSYMLRGADTSTFVDASAVLSNGSASNPNLSGVTTVTDKAWV